MRNIYGHVSIDVIPKISDKQIEEMLTVMRPIAEVKYNRCRRYREILFDGVNRRRVAYTWDSKLGRPIRIYAGALACVQLLTYHKYGAPSFFKPSFAEVLSQIRSHVRGWEHIRFFELQPIESVKDQAQSVMINAGYHVAICSLFGEEDMRVIDEDWSAYKRWADAEWKAGR